MRAAPLGRRLHGFHRHAGAALVESVVVLPTLIFLVLAIWQAATAYHAKNSVNYATHEAARAGSLNGASVSSMQLAFQKGHAGLLRRWARPGRTRGDSGHGRR